MTALEIIAVALSLTGYWLVIRQQWTGMALWVVANGLWLGLAIDSHHWPQALMWAVYLAGAAIGTVRWRRARRHRMEQFRRIFLVSFLAHHDAFMRAKRRVERDMAKGARRT